MLQTEGDKTVAACNFYGVIKLLWHFFVFVRTLVTISLRQNLPSLPQLSSERFLAFNQFYPSHNETPTAFFIVRGILRQIMCESRMNGDERSLITNF